MTHRVFITLLFSFLLLSLQTDAYAQKNTCIKGEGNTVKEDITLDNLKGINLGIAGDVILTQGNMQKITIEGQKNIIDNIQRDVKNGNWNISFNKNVSEAKDIIIYITMPTLESVAVSGSGSIKTTNKFSGLKDLRAAVSGSGDLVLEYDAQSTDASLSGSGEIDLKGKSTSLSVAISGSGDVNASDLTAEDCKIHISGSGDASVNANHNLETTISGSGDVSYSGKASLTTRISGSGEINRIR